MINNIVVQAILIITLLIIVIWFIRLNRATRLEKRFKDFCVSPIKDDTKPFLDKLNDFYLKTKRKLSKKLTKIKIFDDYSRKYEKYSDKSKIIREDSMNYISDKIICGILCVSVIIISDILRYEMITIMQALTAFLVGFFIPDIYWRSRDKIRIRQIERDMLKAIIIMNNSFKSGLSIMQAIYMVSKELDGPIKDEFKKMYIDISFGLEMDLVFERFAKRVNTEDAKYITTSLSVLNKTGGNIVQVFASVERNAFTRKKLKEELGALSATSNAIFKILVSLPVVLSGIILFLNPSYFTPLFNTSIGLIIFALILSIYVSYIIIVKKIVRIKE